MNGQAGFRFSLFAGDPSSGSPLVDTGINKLTAGTVHNIDDLVRRYLSDYEYLHIGMIKNAQIILTKAYGNKMVEDSGVYCSVSKPVTSIILMKLVAQGKIKCIDDNIWKYSK